MQRAALGSLDAIALELGLPAVLRLGVDHALLGVRHGSQEAQVELGVLGLWLASFRLGGIAAAIAV